MIILISGASHTGKTVLAQKLLEKYDVNVTMTVSMAEADASDVIRKFA